MTSVYQFALTKSVLKQNCRWIPMLSSDMTERLPGDMFQV
jgi:hypothetical protein